MTTPDDELEARRAAEERAKTEAVFTSIGDGAVATDEFGKITRINPAALKILGYKEREVLGEWFPNVIVTLDDDGTPVSLIDRPITRAFLTGQSVSEKTYYRKKNGVRLPVSVTVSPIIHNDRPIGAIEVFRDISIEYEIDRMKSEFISLASHQLRTPLSAIKTYTHMLMDGYMGEVNAEQRRSLSTIVGASNRMNELISTLLNITRIESGSISIMIKSVSARRLAEEVIKELEHTANSRDIALKLVAGDHPYTLKTDPLITKEIITNLTSNAIKYTSDGGSVTIRLASRADTVTVSVQDTGLGIPKVAQAQIFTKFFRAPNVVKLETSGTGLGLYLVKGLAERLGGKVGFTSEEHKGSTFFLTLPKNPSSDKSLPKQTST